jgi:hypothetical protein
LFKPTNEEMQMQTFKRSLPWTVRIAHALETVLFAAATLVVASGIALVFLRPALVLA